MHKAVMAVLMIGLSSVSANAWEAQRSYIPHDGMTVNGATGRIERTSSTEAHREQRLQDEITEQLDRADEAARFEAQLIGLDKFAASISEQGSVEKSNARKQSAEKNQRQTN